MARTSQPAGRGKTQPRPYRHRREGGDLSLSERILMAFEPGEALVNGEIAERVGYPNVIVGVRIADMVRSRLMHVVTPRGPGSPSGARYAPGPLIPPAPTWGEADDAAVLSALADGIDRTPTAILQLIGGEGPRDHARLAYRLRLLAARGRVRRVSRGHWTLPVAPPPDPGRRLGPEPRPAISPVAVAAPVSDEVGAAPGFALVIAAELHRLGEERHRLSREIVACDRRRAALEATLTAYGGEPAPATGADLS